MQRRVGHLQVRSVRFSNHRELGIASTKDDQTTRRVDVTRIPRVVNYMFVTREKYTGESEVGRSILGATKPYRSLKSE